MKRAEFILWEDILPDVTCYDFRWYGVEVYELFIQIAYSVFNHLDIHCSIVIQPCVSQYIW
jgi:hypothetical protein